MGSSRIRIDESCGTHEIRQTIMHSAKMSPDDDDDRSRLQQLVPTSEIYKARRIS